MKRRDFFKVLVGLPAAACAVAAGVDDVDDTEPWVELEPVEGFSFSCTYEGKPISGGIPLEVDWAYTTGTINTNTIFNVAVDAHA